MANRRTTTEGSSRFTKSWRGSRCAKGECSERGAACGQDRADHGRRRRDRRGNCEKVSSGRRLGFRGRRATRGGRTNGQTARSGVSPTRCDFGRKLEGRAFRRDREGRAPRRPRKQCWDQCPEKHRGTAGGIV